MKFQNNILVLILVSIFCSLLMLSPGCSSGKDVTVTSTVTAGHAHKVTISGSDISKEPDEKIYTTESAGSPSHTHMIRMTNREYAYLKQGTIVNLTTSPAADDHTHNYKIAYRP
jgi:hypothetical protein